MHVSKYTPLIPMMIVPFFIQTLIGADKTAGPAESPAGVESLPWTLDEVLYGIRMAESRDGARKDIFPHPDGSSWGVYGVTQKAVDELIRCKKLVRFAETTAIRIEGFYFRIVGEWTLADPEACAAVAEGYLLLMHLQHTCPGWLEAAGWYHGGCSERRRKYMKTVEDFMRSARKECLLSQSK